MSRTLEGITGRRPGHRSRFPERPPGGSLVGGGLLAVGLLLAGGLVTPLEAQHPPLPGPPSGFPMPETERSLVHPEPEEPREVAAGDHLMYIGTYREGIYVLDEETESVVDVIELETGMARTLYLNPEATRFYVRDISYEQLEVVDLATRQTLDVFTLSQGNEMVRIWNVAVAPGDEYAVLLVQSYRELPDRFVVGSRRLVQLDLNSGEVLREVPWPDDQERLSATMHFSQDGRWLYFFLDDIRIYDTTDFTEVDRWDYSDALGGGLEEFSFGFPNSPFDEPGYFTGLFRTTDPIQERRLLGIARVQLDERDIEFFPLGPDWSGLRFSLAPGQDHAYALTNDVDDWQFWTIDMNARRITSQQRFRGRARMSLQTSSSGDVLYIYNAGNTIDLYEAATYRYLRTIVLDADTTTSLFVLPRPDSPTGDR